MGEVGDARLAGLRVPIERTAATATRGATTTTSAATAVAGLTTLGCGEMSWGLERGKKRTQTFLLALGIIGRCRGGSVLWLSAAGVVLSATGCWTAS